MPSVPKTAQDYEDDHCARDAREEDPRAEALEILRFLARIIFPDPDPDIHRVSIDIK